VVKNKTGDEQQFQLVVRAANCAMDLSKRAGNLGPLLASGW
jgi:hypothetical protein